MESTTISTRTLEIGGMSGDACVQKVKGALKDVNGVSTQSVKVGSATIGSDQNGCKAACMAINNAGFKVREDAPNSSSDGSNSNATKNDPAQSRSGDKAGVTNLSERTNASDSTKHAANKI